MVRFEVCKKDLKFDCNYKNGELLVVPNFDITTGIVRELVEAIVDHLQGLFLYGNLEEVLLANAGDKVSLKFYDIVVY